MHYPNIITPYGETMMKFHVNFSVNVELHQTFTEDFICMGAQIWMFFKQPPKVPRKRQQLLKSNLRRC